MARLTREELGIQRRVYQAKCGCLFRAGDDPFVKRGTELHGYLVEACAAHDPAGRAALEKEGGDG